MSRLVITESTSDLTLVSEESHLDVTTVEQELEVTVDSSTLTIEETTQDLTIQEAGKSELQIFSNAMLVKQFFSGEGAVADQDTIIGDGTQFDPLRAPDMLRISFRLGEFDTGDAKAEAITNLGLHIIDGGLF